MDAVWTDDGDAFMVSLLSCQLAFLCDMLIWPQFGAKTLIRFFWNANEMTVRGKKDIEKVRIYQAKDIVKKFPGLDQEGKSSSFTPDLR